MLWVLGGVFVTFYSFMYISVRKVINYLQLQKDCDDKATLDNCDGKSRSLIGIIIAVGVALIFLNWCMIWFGHIQYSY